MSINQKGSSLLEYLLVVVVVGVMVGLMSNLPNAINLISKSNHLSQAREIASKQIEDKRAISYSNLAAGTVSVSDPRISLLPGGNGEVLVEDCDVNICQNGENIKKVIVKINWKENNKDQTVALETFIGQGGLNQ